MEAIHSSSHNTVILITTHGVHVPELTGQRRHFVIITDTSSKQKWVVRLGGSYWREIIVYGKRCVITTIWHTISNNASGWLTKCWYPPQAEWAWDAAEWWWENWSWIQTLNCRRIGWEGAPRPGSHGEVPLEGAAWCGGPQQLVSPWCHMSGCGRDCSHHMYICGW